MALGEVMTSTKMEYQAGHGMRPPCNVCEVDVLDFLEPEKTRVSERWWLFVPCNRELLHICLNCGNTLRSKRLE